MGWFLIELIVRQKWKPLRLYDSCRNQQVLFLCFHWSAGEACALHALIRCEPWHHFVKKKLCRPAASAGVAWRWGHFTHFPFGAFGSEKLLKRLAMTYVTTVVLTLWTLVADAPSDQGRTIIWIIDYNWIRWRLDSGSFATNLILPTVEERNRLTLWLLTVILSLENGSIQNFPPNLCLVFPPLVWMSETEWFVTPARVEQLVVHQQTFQGLVSFPMFISPRVGFLTSSNNPNGTKVYSFGVSLTLAFIG